MKSNSGADGAFIKNRRGFALCCILLAAWVAVMLILSSQSGEQTAKLSGSVAETVVRLFVKSPTGEQIAAVHMILRKAAHAVVFGVFALICSVGASCLGRYRPLQCALIISAVCVVFAVVDELHKIPIGGRHADVADMCINMAGGLAAVWIYYAVRRARSARKNR